MIEKIKDGIPAEVKREIVSFYSGFEKGDLMRAIKDGERAYIEMKVKLEKAEIPHAEKNAIEANLKNMFPKNYVKQNAEVDSMINTVLIAMKHK